MPLRLSEIRIAGFGGQGVILSATIIGKAASIYSGGHAVMTQAFGPESRGGSSSAQVVISDAPILYPYVTRTDVLVALSQEAYTRFLPELKDGGTLIVERDLVRLHDVGRGIRVYGVPATRLAEELGRRMVMNVVIVGFFAAVTQLLEPDALRRAVEDSVPEALRELNLRAFEKGFEHGVASVPLERPEPEALPQLLGG
ncbi:MAG: 2-oxoacid:acceptor oxidoreductase family protein [Bryobacteraceae bacterium]|nr:2-oxoacid:acceptor oxidoreductase family protein [Bryobacteraceae bacterium]